MTAKAGSKKLQKALEDLRLAEEMFTDHTLSKAERKLWLRRLKRAQRRYSRLKCLRHRRCKTGADSKYIKYVVTV